YIVYVFQCDSIQGHFNDTVKAENRDFVVKGKPDSIFREQGPTGIKTPSHIALRAKVTHDDKVGTVEGFMTSIYDIIVLLSLVGQTILEMHGKLMHQWLLCLLDGRKVLNIMTLRGSEAGFGGVLKDILDVTDDRAASYNFEKSIHTFTYSART
ncbi:hypothetical protein U0070_012951, partial [Myodes glareolus]